MPSVIQVSDLSKSYRLGAIGGGTLRADVSRWWARLRGLPDPNLKLGEEAKSRLNGQEFWALKDISFEVRQGEILGVIGRNGAGKSTLLKILSRVTAPTSGEVRVKGRVASLLEVGTGFHPELTGRENVYLNGAILGMTKAEVKKKFDEIVAFSGVEEFIDTPVKRYSSGMYVRLAFAVAAHLEPEILIVDEVLAVGDGAFQKNCIERMAAVALGGRTVLFVSHNIAAVHGFVPDQSCSTKAIRRWMVIRRQLSRGILEHEVQQAECSIRTVGELARRRLRSSTPGWRTTGQNPIAFSSATRHVSLCEFASARNVASARSWFSGTRTASRSHLRPSGWAFDWEVDLKPSTRSRREFRQCGSHVGCIQSISWLPKPGLLFWIASSTPFHFG